MISLPNPRQKEQLFRIGMATVLLRGLRKARRAALEPLLPTVSAKLRESSTARQSSLRGPRCAMVIGRSGGTHGPTVVDAASPCPLGPDWRLP